MTYFTNLFQKYIRGKDIRVFKNKLTYFVLFRLIRKFLDDDLIVDIYNFKILASKQKNKTSHALLRKCDFDDQSELRILTKLANEDKIFFYDCGSNYGFYSLFVANLNLSNKVIAIEASSKTSQALQKNIELNSQKNIKILNYALSDTDNEKIVFNESNNDWESSINHKKFEIKNQTEIFTKKIDTITDEINNLDEYKLIIKLDIEGNEFKALAGGLKTIEKYSPIIIIEFSKFIFNEKNSKIFFNKFLQNYNYKIFSTNYSKMDENEIYDLLDQLDKKHDTIGNYFLVKENSTNYDYFLNERSSKKKM